LSEYRVNLDIFAGPLDLLLYLVRKEELDIYDIPIARITEQYLKYIEILKELDIDLAGDFLVMAATLMEIKSAMLLPTTDPEEETAEGSEDPRANLIRQLLEYKRFKDAANLLSDAAEERNLRFTRPDSILSGIQPDGEPELDLDQVSIWTLLEAFDHILKATGHVSGYDHIRDDTPIDLYQIEILHRLQAEGPMPLGVIFEGRQNRIVMIGLFLAMLELIRDRLIWAEQPQSPGPIYLKSMTDVPAEQAVQNAIYAARQEAAVAVTDTQEAVIQSAPAQAEEVSVEQEEEEQETLEELFDQQKPRPRIPIQEFPAGPSPQAPVPEDSIQKSQQKTE
jgi:segregation and condensation protein A